MKNHWSSSHKIGSIGTRGSSLNHEEVAPKAKRKTDIKNVGKQGFTICPECKTVVHIKKAVGEEKGKYGRVPGIKLGDLIIGNHRVGGGMYSVRSGDVLCFGAKLPIPKAEET